MILFDILIAGVSAGAVYGLVALGLVLTHSATNVVNFAQGSLAAVAVFVFISANDGRLPLPIAIAAALACAMALAALIHLLVIRWAQRLSEMNAVLATVALLLIFDGVIRQIWGTVTLSFPRFLPEGSLTLAGVSLSKIHLTVAAVAFATAAVLWAVIRFTRVGLVIRGAADNAEAARLMGFSPHRIAVVVWIIGGLLAAIAGLLLGHLLAPRPEMALGVLVKGFTGAVIGGFVSPMAALMGALTLGIAEGLTSYYVGSLVQDAVPLALLVLVLTLRPTGLARTTKTRSI